MRLNRVNVNRIALLEEDERAQLIRKATPIVALREAVLTDRILRHTMRPAYRSRKHLHLYAGAKALFAIVEGNPRWFIGIVAPLLKSYAQTRTKISIASQTLAVETASNRFRALLKTIPYQIDSGHSSSRGLLTLINSIGSYLYRGVVQEKFTPEPPLSFIVDSTISDGMEGSLGKALNAGAFVAEETAEEPIFGSLRGKRFRLSYLLAVHYRLPLVLGRPISLNSILQESAGTDRNESQMKLFE
jgi:hypothetical protein